jgi:hypothetical protein
MDQPQSPRIARERRTVGAMVDIYCRAHHGRAESRCDSCRELFAYAMARLDHCPYGPDKPTCKVCPVHCYRKDMRAQMRQVMAFAGPRMLFSHPVMAVRHLLDERSPVPERPTRARSG